MTRAAIYARVSRADEKEILDNQLRTLREYVAEHGFALVREFTEVISGGSDDRPGFNLLMEAVGRRDKPDLVVFTSLSRMTRGGVGAALDVLRRLEAHRVGWVFVEQPILNNDAQTPKLVRDILLAVFAAIDEDYRARISRATKSAYARRKQAAEALGGTVKWGRPRKSSPPAPAEPAGAAIIAPISRPP